MLWTDFAYLERIYKPISQGTGELRLRKDQNSKSKSGAW